MDVVFEVFVAAPPVPKGRPRAKIVRPRSGGQRVQMYTPPETADWEELVERDARLIWRNRPPLQCRLVGYAEFWLPRPKSVKDEYPITSRADTDNLVKAVLDAVESAGVMTNDRLVTDITGVKRYADPPNGYPVGAMLRLWVP